MGQGRGGVGWCTIQLVPARCGAFVDRSDERGVWSWTHLYLPGSQPLVVGVTHNGRALRRCRPLWWRRWGGESCLFRQGTGGVHGADRSCAFVN